MNNVNMGGVNAMGGPVGGGMPMMNNGAPGGRRPQMPVNDSQRSQLNTYIYDYFLRHGMYDCARSLYQSDPTMKLIKESPGRRRDDNGNGEDGEDGDSKDDTDSKRPDDLPRSDVPRECPESCFLYEWWCLFWDMFNAQRGKGEAHNVLQYVNHTTAQSRMRQDQQQNMLRGVRSGTGDMNPAQYQQLLRMQQANGVGPNNNELQRKAMQNNRSNPTPQHLMQMQQQKQQAMQRDPSSGDHQQRSGSPGSAENAASPSKRPRIDGAGFNPQQMPNGRGQPMPQQQVGDSGPSNAIQAAHMQLPNGMEPNNLTAQQFQNMPGGPNQRQQSVNNYQQGLAQQQATQGQLPGKGMPNAGGPANQGSPMMNQGQDGAAIQGYYNAGELGVNMPRAGQGGQAPAGGGGNHALQDYQMQLMLLEQQNKKRLMMARQEQDSMTTMPGQREGGGPMGSNGQPFQGTSPQGRSVNSPNPSEQMKRGTPHMNPTGMPSPVPEGQSRGSPSGMNFNMPGGQMDPNLNPQYFMKNNGMDPQIVGMNGMRPPSSHPAGGFNSQGMTANQMQQAAMAQQRQQVANGNWTGPNGNMIPGPNQGAPQQAMGQRPMAPPAAPVTNGRTNPSSPQLPGAATPQLVNKPNPNNKKKTDAKENKTKRAKKGTNATTGATPSADSAQEPATPTPATPMTPVHNKGFQNGGVQPVTNGQPAAPMNTANASQPDLQGFGLGDGTFNVDFNSLEFANVSGPDVLQDFDFDSFLHNDDTGVDNFAFDAASYIDNGEMVAE